MLNVFANQEDGTAITFQIDRTERPEKGRGICCHVTMRVYRDMRASSAFRFESVQ